MSEIEYVGATKAPQQPYASQSKPYLKDSEQRTLYKEVERGNKKLQKKITEIKKEDPSDFHRARTLLSADHNALNRQKEQREIQIENQRIGKKMHEIYESKRISLYGQHKELGQTIDCNDRWQQRNSLYSPPPRPQSARKPTGSATTSPAPKSNIHTSLGLAICAGCGVKSFAGADGPALFPCPSCKKVYYCTATCQSIDLQSHKQLCKYESSSHKGSPMSLARPNQDYWTQNSSMAVARHELHQRAARQVSLTPVEEVEERARVAKLVQAAKDKEEAAQIRQRRIEWLAENNMDGPRPCMFANGSRI